MRSSLFLIFLALFSGRAVSQSLSGYHLSIVEDTIIGMPGLQSFATGEHNGQWLLIGGRTDGLHRRQPWASFQENANNRMAYVIDPESDAVWSTSLESLPPSLYEQLQSTNTLFHQIDTTLYVVGGYGYSPTAGDHITFPNLTAIHLPGLIDAIKSGSSINDHFQQLTDNRVQVTGGYLGFLEDRFYIIGGQKFIGRYNPMGPTHGPGFIQEYTNEIRSFSLSQNNGALELTNYESIRDTAHLHRRDLNVVPQVFPNGQLGFTAFSGVFQYGQDLPWLNTVDIWPGDYSVNTDFSQFLNQYHTAHLALHDAASNEMHTVFFGGISRYSLDQNGNLVDDPEVPFVKTISLVTRDGNGGMTELQIGEMPALLGSSAEFLMHPDVPRTLPEIVDLGNVASDSLLVGYIVGGIESTLPNIFWINDGTQSTASSRVFKVYMVKGTVSSSNELKLNSQGFFDIEVFPNPASDDIKIEFSARRSERISVSLHDQGGNLVKVIRDTAMTPGRYQFSTDCSSLPAGVYVVKVSSSQHSASRQFVIQ